MMSADLRHARATRQDLHSCYRLLLQREPDRGGWDTWTTLLASVTLTVQQLVDLFLRSDEYRALHGDAGSPVLIELKGFRMFVRPDDVLIGAGIAATRSYEPHVSRVLEALLQPGAVFVDIGANIGYFTLLAASRVGSHGRAIAVEPNPDNCRLLLRSCAVNAFTQVDLYPFAAADVEGYRKFLSTFPGSNGILAAAVDGSDILNPQAGIVKTVVLDRLLSAAERVDIVKLDIEGAEPLALRGMQRLIAQHRPRIVTEFNPQAIVQTSGVPAEAYLDQLRGHHYRIFVVGWDGALSTVQSNEQIFQAYHLAGTTHLDLFACPEERALDALA